MLFNQCLLLARPCGMQHGNGREKHAAASMGMGMGMGMARYCRNNNRLVGYVM